jgi:DNA ligase-1
MDKLYDDWSVQLAKTYKPGMIKDGTWFAITQKINGVRCTYFANDLISRTGHKFMGFDQLNNELDLLQKAFRTTYGIDLTFDGELRLDDDYCKGLTDNEAFKRTVGICNSINDYRDKNDINFIIFDAIPSKEYIEGSRTKYHARHLWVQYELLKLIIVNNIIHIKVVPQPYEGDDTSRIEYYSEFAYEHGWEGIMINLDKPYEFKRSSGLLKYKKFNTIDLEIIDMQEGIGKYEGMCGALICKYKNNTVAVGSGMVDLQRYKFWKNKDKYIGKLCEVKYKDITNDKETGLESLQFPIFLGIKLDKEVPDA